MPYTQDNRLLAIDTPLGEDVLLLQGFTGQEGMSRLFSFDVDLLSEESSIPFKQIVGQKVTLTITLADGDKRYINGFVSRFAQCGSDARFTYYRAEVVPWLWFLTRTTDCRIFQKMAVPDIIIKIFQDLGFSDYKNLLAGNFEPRDYCVQYRETDFSFVSRLMEQVGIFYFFEHDRDKHTLVLANSASVHRPCVGQPHARCDFSVGAVLDEDIISGCQVEQELRPGRYALTDYNFETPSTSLAVNTASIVSVGGNGKFEIYDYPGEYAKKAQGESLVKIRMEEEESPQTLMSGTSGCRAFVPGYRFDLEGHYAQEMNKSYVLTEVQHVASVGESYAGAGSDAGESYSNHFTCIPHDVAYRPSRATPRPTVQGPQTAVVVGPAGEEIHTDKYGRVKVQFHWDREGKRDENSSCWIRVSHPWAGKGWGSVSIPRIGQEVIVDFLEGDPDQPIITGRVYNAEQMPPYGLPAGGVVSGIKSNTTPGGGGYNEMSMDDTKGKEKITVHAQYDMDTTIEHDETHTVKTGNRTIKVETGTHTETIKGDTKITIQTGAYALDVAANTHTSTAAKEIVVTSKGAHIHLTAATEIKLQVGASKLLMKSDGSISLEGVNVTINGSSSVTVKGQIVHSEATAEHQTKGAIVISEGSATNTVKGGMVMLNP